MTSSFLKKRFFYIPASALFVSGLSLFGLSACGDEVAGPKEPSSQLPDDPPAVSSESKLSQEGGTSSSSAASKPSSSSSQASKPVASSSSKTATESSEEVLNEPSLKVSGSCGPKTPIIEKGGMATWSFYREGGDVFDAIMAPFVWKFPELNKTVQGNGMNSVDVSYEQSGTYTATLNVDGADVVCDPLQVQGIPITINSCKADKETAKAGETITWKVEAESDANITGYAWTSTLGTISGSGTSATLSAEASMHKQKVAPMVAVTNDDRTTQTYQCDGVTVLDPESVDLVLIVADVNSPQYGETNRANLPDSMFIPAQSPITAQVPNTAKANCNLSCVPKVGADYMSLKITVDGNQVDNIGYFNPGNSCAPGKKFSIEATVTALCMVSPN